MSVAPNASDPRLGSEASVQPVVAKPSTGLPVWVIVAGTAALALILFLVLDARRRNLTVPAVSARSPDVLGSSEAPPPLYIPPAPQPVIVAMPAPLRAVTPSPIAPPTQQAPRSAPLPPAYVPQPMIEPSRFNPAPTPPARVTGDPALVLDRTGASAPQGAAASDSGSGSAPTSQQKSTIAGSRASAGVMANRTTTVPQGTLVPAVLETALDSNHPGLARAIVSRDVRGFDGTRVLIPRGSRLIGEYGADVENGQNRMLVNWIRLLRPDGASIAIGSPAADTLGRGGVRASVNSHFFERFAGAILQSALDVGVNLASRSVDAPVFVALPGAVQNSAGRTGTAQVRPTLKVRAATSVSVFVARDLDFTSVEKP